MAKNWNEADENLLRRKVQEWNDKSQQIDMGFLAKRLNRTEEAIYLKAYRMKLPLRPQCARPTMRRIMELKFGDVTLFQANRQFYVATGISQKRWPSLLYGYEEPTQDEIERVANYLHIDQRDWIRFVKDFQMNLFDGKDS